MCPAQAALVVPGLCSGPRLLAGPGGANFTEWSCSPELGGCDHGEPVGPEPDAGLRPCLCPSCRCRADGALGWSVLPWKTMSVPVLSSTLLAQCALLCHTVLPAPSHSPSPICCWSPAQLSSEAREGPFSQGKEWLALDGCQAPGYSQGNLGPQAGSTTTPFWGPLSLPQLASVLSVYGPGCSSPQGFTGPE